MMSASLSEDSLTQKRKKKIDMGQEKISQFARVMGFFSCEGA
jgi:hypothetical protein